MPTRRTRSTPGSTTMSGNAAIVGAGGTTASRGHKRRRTRRTPQQFGVTRAGTSGVTASANLADKVIWDVQQIAGNLTPVQQRAIKHSMNVRLGLV